jgi:type IV pilus assembly protein PilQ
MTHVRGFRAAKAPGRSPLVYAAPIVAALVASIAASGPPAPGPEVRAISGRLDGGLSTVLIESTEPVAYLTSQPDPLTVFVDLRNVATASWAGSPAGPMPSPVAGVKLEPAVAPDGAPVARVRVGLERPSTHRVRSSRNFIFVEIERGASPRPATPAPAAQARGDIAPPANRGPATLATRLVGVKPLALPDGSGIALTGNGRLVASHVEEISEPPARVFLDFEGVAMGSVPATTAINAGDVERVRVAVNRSDPIVTRVVIDLARALPYTIETIGEELRVLFSKAASAASALMGSTPPASAPSPAPAPAAAPASAPAPAPSSAPASALSSAPASALSSAPASGPSSAPAPAPSSAPVSAPAPAPSSAPAPAPSSAPASATPSSAAAPAARQAQPLPPLPPPAQPGAAQPAGQRFQGDPVTFDFQGADLRAVLRTFADISGLNVVIDPTIQGTVDVSLREVPWDQALDIILKANKLGYSVDGTIVRIAPLAVLAQENEERRKLQEAEALAGELRVLTHPLSYARAQELVPIITNSALSSRGEVQVDTRTNTLIIRDLADRLTAAAELIATLDKPQPQVEIEARIVQTSRDFARALGVQWGFNGQMTPQLGNTTNLAFPNAIGVNGRAGGTQGPGGVDTGVSLPVPSPTSGVGIALGSINGALNLDVALTALERTGRGRLLSTPRVSTQNNVEAEITQGVQIPIQTQANNTITVTFKDAALQLRVTPQITAAGTVIMRIVLENAAPDYSRSVNGIPPIDTQRAVTSVLVSDGETTVIGGIYTSREQVVEGRTPGLHRIPLLGWLFKRDEMNDESRELLIFITPRITRG